MKRRPFWTLLALPGGELVEDTSLPALGRNGSCSVPLSPEDMIPMPFGAEICLLPGRRPPGKPLSGDRRPFSNAASAILPPGYLRLLLPAFQRNPRAPTLPLLGFTCVAWRDDRFWVAAQETDDTRKWDPSQYHTVGLPHLIKARLKRRPENRLLSHLAVCALDSGCYNAQNIFYERWEGGIPVSPACNSTCRGCISLQPSKRVPSPQNRISFVPTVEEMTEVVLHHLESSPEAIASFG
ncbi:MAG: radical SAM protein, partial [Armatimonadetes bacterium]|nr:radical SAM protein [Armatimonadota bacterium]